MKLLLQRPFRRVSAEKKISPQYRGDRLQAMEQLAALLRSGYPAAIDPQRAAPIERTRQATECRCRRWRSPIGRRSIAYTHRLGNPYGPSFYTRPWRPA